MVFHTLSQTDTLKNQINTWKVKGLKWEDFYRVKACSKYNGIKVTVLI